MKNHLTALPFLARAARAAVAGLQGWVETLAGRGADGPRRAPAPRPPRAQRDDAEAMNLLGLLCLKGRGNPHDHAQARHWFQKAAGGQIWGQISTFNNFSICFTLRCDGRSVFSRAWNLAMATLTAGYSTSPIYLPSSRRVIPACRCPR